MALKEERTWYRLMLKEARNTTWTEKISDCGMDAKKLYTLINNLTNNNKDNPLPKSQSDDRLANKFTQYFMSKIKSMRDTLEIHSCINQHGGKYPNFQGSQK